MPDAGDELGVKTEQELIKALESEINKLEYEYNILQKVENYRAGNLETVTLDELEKSLDLDDQD